jgi:CrcB protein
MSATRSPRARIESAALIAVGGFAGANVRYLAGLALPGLPGTLLANVLGSLALGFLLHEATRTGLLTARARTVLATGFLSSFTTYSTFALQSAQAPPLLLVANVLATYLLGFGAAALGRVAAGSLDGRWSA